MPFSKKSPQNSDFADSNFIRIKNYIRTQVINNNNNVVMIRSGSHDKDWVSR